MSQGAGRPAPPVRADYAVWRRATTRWADDDVYGHMNNARYYELFDTAVNGYLVAATGVNIRALPAVGIVAETSCRYFREIVFPTDVDMGLLVERIGRSSVVYRIGLFAPDSDEASAEGRFVHVYVDNTEGHGSRPVRPIPEEIRSVVTSLTQPA